MRRWVHDITGFFFPLYCPVCGNVLHLPGEVICLSCEQKMPFTHYINDPENPVAQLFWGRIEMEGAFSLLRFEKGSKYQPLLHLLKYKGHRKMGVFLGRMLGHALKNSVLSQADLVVPVPLHPKKERIRGYNQSSLIAQGVAEITGIPLHERILFRRENTASQTRRNRYERWENMEDVFGLCREAEGYSDLTFLLIDDVVTTGSTLEACATTLKRLPGAGIYVATLACA
ncbi:MAG: ComF family protein [Bacteroidales bacterium]|nr:ComF family protein [Bacteroidales bacterium]MDT8431147.1 ComF family protein [Bacteroidales bacterium]